MKNFNPINNIIDRVKKKSVIDDKDFIRLHHVLCKEYGFISLKEFQDIPIPMFWNLIREIARDYNEQKKETDKLNKKVR